MGVCGYGYLRYRYLRLLSWIKDRHIGVRTVFMLIVLEAYTLSSLM